MMKIALIAFLTILMCFSAASRGQNNDRDNDNSNHSVSGVEAKLNIDEDITDAEIRDYLEVREKYKDDPKTLELLDQIQEAAGITEKDIARATGQTPAGASRDGQAIPDIDPDPRTAEQAYRNGDYETALKHYQALAAEGDGYANLMLGLMYHQGQGVDGDTSKARAYYERAADYGEERGSELSRSLEREMSATALERAEQDYSAIRDTQRQASAPAPQSGDEREKYPAVILENGRPAQPDSQY